MTDSNPFHTDADQASQTGQLGGPAADPQASGVPSMPVYGEGAPAYGAAPTEPLAYGASGYNAAPYDAQGQGAPVYGSPQQGTPAYGASMPQGAPAYGVPQGAPLPQGSPLSAQSVGGPVALDQPWYGCPPLEAFTRFWKKYATFSGRASRSEYWWMFLFNVIISNVLSWLGHEVDAINILSIVWGLATLIPFLALTTRRLHDSNRSGGWIALLYGLSIGGIAIVYIAVISMVFALAGTSLYGMGLDDVLDMYRYYGEIPSQIAGPLASSLTGVGIAVLIGLIMALAGFILDVVFMASPSKPEGVRFDRVAAPAAGQQGFPPAQSYGQPYPSQPQPYAQPGAPAQGQQFSAAPQYGQPTPSQSTAQPDSQSFYGQPQQQFPEGQQPWQGQ